MDPATTVAVKLHVILTALLCPQFLLLPVFWFPAEGAATTRIVNGDLTSNLVTSDLYSRPVRVIAAADPAVGTATSVAE